MTTSLALWLSVLLLLGNAFFVGAEFAAMAAKRSSLEPLADQGSRAARTTLDALEEVSSLLVMAQFGITVCSLGLGALSEAALEHLFAGWFEAVGLSESLAVPVALALSLLLVVYLHVVVGEMIPKNLTLAVPDRAALILVPPLYWMARGLRPLIVVMHHVAQAIVRMFGVEPKDEMTSAFTAEEVGLIVAESHREGLIAGEQHGLVRRSLEFSDRLARDVAVPLDKVITLPLGSTPQDLEKLVAKHGFSRYVLTDSDGDLAGYLHLKDILYAREEDFDEPIPAKRIRRLATVRQDEEVEDVLATMQRTGRHLAQVLDEGEQVVGVVFLEDVIEELVGEVTDQSQRQNERAAARRAR